MVISDEQIKQIANSIVSDVHYYIQEHLEEYEKFLAEETSNNEQCSKIKKEEILYGEEKSNSSYFSTNSKLCK